MEPEIEFATLPGRDREGAEAMLSQARLRMNPLDEIQVRHLLAIGRRAGVAAGIAAAVRTNSRFDRDPAPGEERLRRGQLS